jgi:predicted DNA-binding transcriptional regulator YafY
MANAQICDAISKKLLIEIIYDGQNRLIEPHAYGYDKLQHELLRAWQIQPAPSDWRTFRVDKSISISTTTTHFAGPRPDYSRDDKAMEHIYCQI